MFRIHVDILNTLPVTAKNISLATSTDSELAKLLNYISEGWPPNNEIPPDLKPFYQYRDCFTVTLGCVMWGSRVVIPTCFRTRILDDLHEAHLGMVKMKSRAREHVW